MSVICRANPVVSITSLRQRFVKYSVKLIMTGQTASRKTGKYLNKGMD